MSLAEHVQELTAKHAKLEQLIREELQHPGCNDLRISALKREKLRIKDQIIKLEGPSIH